MGQKLPLVERNVWLKEFYISWNLVLSNTRMDTFEHGTIIRTLRIYEL